MANIKKRIMIATKWPKSVLLVSTSVIFFKIFFTKWATVYGELKHNKLLMLV